MYIDLTDPDDFTIENRRELLASKDYSRNRQLRVTTDGRAFLSDEVGNTNLNGIKFRFETWGAGNGYCGKKAAASDRYVLQIYEDLNNSWKRAWWGTSTFRPKLSDLR